MSDDQRGDSAPAGRIRVMIVEDHAMVAEGLALAISAEPDMELVCSATSVAAAIDSCVRESPNVALVDYRLPDGDGAEFTRQLRDRCPDSAVVMVTAAEDPAVVSEAISAGCVGFVRKSGSVEDVIAAVRAAANGEAFFPGDVLQAVVRGLNGARPAVGWDMTDREIDVLRLLAKGQSRDEIAESLFISQHTVRNHIRNLLAKLGAHTQLQAVVISVREGILKSDEIG